MTKRPINLIHFSGKQSLMSTDFTRNNICQLLQPSKVKSKCPLILLYDYFTSQGMFSTRDEKTTSGLVNRYFHQSNIQHKYVLSKCYKKLGKHYRELKSITMFQGRSVCTIVALLYR